MDKIKIKKIEYPSEEFFKFGSSGYGKKISDETIEKWINEGIESVKNQLENNIESPYSFRASGDSIVIVFYSQDIEEDVFDDRNYFSVIVAKNYEQGDFFISDVRNIESESDIRIRKLENEIEELKSQLKEERKKSGDER